MLDIRFVREHPELIKADLQKRNDAEKLKWLNELIEKDTEYWQFLQVAEQLRQKRNELTKQVQGLLAEKKDASKIISEAKKIPEQIKEAEQKQVLLKERVDYYLMRLPNTLHESVPVGKDDSANVVVRSHGKAAKPDFEVVHHGQIALRKNLADFERAVKISGEAFYFLKGNLALLDISLQRFALDLLIKKKFTIIAPPFMMRRKPYEGVTDLSDFENVMYKIDNDDLYLIATSEHPMAAMYQNEILSGKDLPIKFAGISACFRREVGKHGLDERGLFRVHQFNKIEQFIFCKPEDSWKFHEEIVSNAEELLKKLEIPYNVTNICTGDIGTVAAKKYDVNGWSPREQKYIELMSCSNCTAYQATRLNIKYRLPNGDKEYLHTLNATMVATTRMLRLILENYQTKDGAVKVPKALQPYMGGLKEL